MNYCPVLKAFAEAASQTAECFQTDQAPFVIKNRLGLAVSVVHSEMFSPMGVTSPKRQVELQDGESLNMDYVHTTSDSDQFSAMTCLSAKNYYIQPSKRPPWCFRAAVLTPLLLKDPLCPGKQVWAPHRLWYCFSWTHSSMITKIG